MNRLARLEVYLRCLDKGPQMGFLNVGNAAKGGMEIYTPVHMDCMCYVSGCNLDGGYARMLSMVYLGRTLKLMQNGLRTTGIGYNTVKMRFMCMRMFFVNLVEKENVFGTEIHLQRGFLECK